MRVNIEFFIIICASLVAWVAPGSILSTAVDNPIAYDGYPVNISKKADEQTPSTVAPENIGTIHKGVLRDCLESKEMPVFVPDPNWSAERKQYEEEAEWFGFHIKKILCEHKKKKAQEAARAAAAGEAPKEIILQVAPHIDRLIVEWEKNPAHRGTARVFAGTADQTSIAFDAQNREASESGYTQSPEEKVDEARAEIVAASIRKRLNITEDHWKIRQANLQQRQQGREIDDDISEEDGPKNVGDELDEDTVRLLDHLFTSLKGNIPKTTVRRSVELEDAVSPRVANLKNPNKVGAGTLRTVSSGDLIDDAIAFAPGTLRNRKQPSRSHSVGHKDSSEARDGRGNRVCKRVCWWRPETESSEEVEPKPRKTPEVEQRKEPERGPHNSYMNFPELNVQYRNNH